MHTNLYLTVDPRFRNLTIGTASDSRVLTKDAARNGHDGISRLWVQTKYQKNTDPIPLATWREAQLIIAEVGGGQTAVTAINKLRALSSGLTAYDPANAAHPTPINMLHYEREVNLYLQGRRLADEYRFGAPADLWLPGKEATTTPVFLPITISERLANQYCVSDPASCN